MPSQIIRPSLPSSASVEELRRAIKLTSDNISRVNERLRGWDYTLTHGEELLVEKPVGYTVTKALAARCYDETLGIEGPMVTGLTVREVTPTTLGITASYDQSATGIIGEKISSTVLRGSAVTLVSITAKTVASITLTPGSWNITGVVGFLTSGIVTAQIGTIGLADNEAPSGANEGSRTFENAGYCSSAGDSSVTIPDYPVDITANTTYYLVAYMASTGTPKAYGRISGTRAKKYDTALSYRVTVMLLD